MQIVPENYVEQGVAAYGVLGAELVVAGHNAAAAGLAYYGLVREEDFLVDFLLGEGRAAAVAKEVLGGGGDAVAEAIGLKAFDKCSSHCGCEVSVLAVRFLYAGPMGAADYVNHWRQGKLLSKVAHRACRLPHFYGEKSRVPGAGYGHLLGVCCGALCGYSGDAFVVYHCRNAGGGMVDHIVLNVSDQLAQFVCVQTLRTG